jgi:hypothetical protein
MFALKMNPKWKKYLTTHRSHARADDLVHVDIESLGGVVLAVPVVDYVKVVREVAGTVLYLRVQEVLYLE